MQAWSGDIKLSFLYISDDVTAKLLFFLEIRVLDANIVQDITKKYLFLKPVCCCFLCKYS
jgi:hypothetical protein